MVMQEAILHVKDLHVSFQTYGGRVRAVRGVSFSLNAGETLAIVGESGSGKSVTNNAIMRMIPEPQGSYDAGKIIFEGKDLLTYTEDEMAHIRGNEIAMIFQDPMTALNPTKTIGEQIMEVFKIHKKQMTKQAQKTRAIELINQVGLNHPKERFKQYPHEFSGGMRQRIVIAIALAAQPKILIADEPTTALDVTIQAQIIELMQEIQHETDCAIIFITHDLGVVANIADKVAVMYAGQIVEVGTANDIFYDPKHPYTWGLLGSMPDMEVSDTDKGGDGIEELFSIPGTPPDMMNLPQGDPFAPRNRYAMAIDYREEPPMFKMSNTHHARTWLLDKRAPDVEVPKIVKDRIQRYLIEENEYERKKNSRSETS